MISQDIIIDEDFNGLSLAAQSVFIRMLIVSDDYGMVPAGEYAIDKLINTPKKVNLSACLTEIVASGLAFRFSYKGKSFFMFKRERFDDYQSYLIAKRTKSEYLRLSKDFIESEDFQEILRSSGDTGCTSIKSREYKVESSKQRVESKEKKDTGDEIEGVLPQWNEVARQLGLSPIIVLTPKRRAGIVARSKEPTFDLKVIFQKIAASDFLRGRNDRKWKVDFDFIFLSPNNYLKILEGKYDRTAHQRGSGGATTASDLDRTHSKALELLRREEERGQRGASG